MPTFKVDQLVTSAEHPNAIGCVFEVIENGSLKIEWKVSPKHLPPFGHSNLELWPESDHHLLQPFNDITYTVADEKGFASSGPMTKAEAFMHCEMRQNAVPKKKWRVWRATIQPERFLFLLNIVETL